MLISLLSLAFGGALDPDHFSIGIPAEVDLVGLAFGVRPELLWRPFGGATHLRVATGVMAGPELVFVPLSLSVRGRWFPKGRVHPIAGIGGELQTFYASDHPVVARAAYFGELGLDVDIVKPWSVGLILEPGFSPNPLLGFGMVARLGVVRSW